MFQTLLLEPLHGGVLGHLLQPLRPLRGADVDLQHFARKYLLLLDEHSDCSRSPDPLMLAPVASVLTASRPSFPGWTVRIHATFKPPPCSDCSVY